MATRVGWVGEPGWNRTLRMGEIGHGIIPIANAKSDGTYNNTSYTGHEADRVYYRYWTISPDSQLTMAANEYPTRITFSDYNTGGWQDEGQHITLCLSNGAGNNVGNEYILVNDKNPDDAFNVESARANIPDATGKLFKGQKLSIGLWGHTELVGHFKVTIETLVHAITWTNPGLSFGQNEYQLTVTKSGYATDNWGETVTYKLRMDGVDKGTFSGNSMTLTLTDADLEVAHTYELVAVSSISSTGLSTSFTPGPVHKTLGYWNGTQWVECIPYYRTESTWQEVWPYYWDGTQWVLCSQR